MKRIVLVVSFLTLSLCLTALVRAAPVYRYETDQGVYTLAPGGSAQVQVYLVETLGAGDTSRISAEGGLFSAAAAITRFGAVPASPSAPTAVAANPAFDGTVLSSVSTTRADIYADRLSPNPPGVLPNAVGRILVGTFTFLAGGANQSTTFQVGDYQPTTDDVITYQFNSLDSQITAGQFTVTVIPEPAGVAGIAGAAILLLRRRRCV